MIKLLILMALLLLGWPLNPSYGAVQGDLWVLGTPHTTQATARVGPHIRVSRAYPRNPKHQAWLGPRPSKWCGWWLRQRMGVSSPKYNLARSWYSFGRPTVAQVGAVVVWPHHVGVIVGRDSKGRWLVQSGNDGGRVKVRPWANIHKAKFRIA